MEKDESLEQALKKCAVGFDFVCAVRDIFFDMRLGSPQGGSPIAAGCKA